MHFNTLKPWLDWQESLHPQSIDLGLERVALIYQRLNPEQKKPITISVAGTNGKGSCVAFLETIYLAQGLRVGAYTSPHIITYNERIKINGQPVSDSFICRAFERIEAVRQDVSLSYFEFSTLAALDIFSRTNLDIQLLEVGLGGRLDAVNIIDADAAIISSICIDHTAWLGNTREAIAIEKAGILRKNTPAIIGDNHPPQSLLDCSAEKQAYVSRINHDFSYTKTKSSWSWKNKNKQFNALPHPKLKGEHQYRNASSVLATIDALQAKLPVSEQAIIHGIKTANLTGRFQLIHSSPPVLLDVSHNKQAAQTLHNYLQADFKHQAIHAIFTMMNDKDMQGVIQLMQPCIKHWYIAPLDHLRATKKSDIKIAFELSHINQVSFNFDSFLSAFTTAKTQATKDNGLILIFGSFFLVSEYLSHFNDSQGSNT